MVTIGDLLMSLVPPRAILCQLVRSVTLTLGLFGLIAACVSTPDQPDWIRIGVTTKADVIARYGQPDLVMAAPDGDTAIYRPTGSGASIPRLEIPTAQAGPFGAPTTRMQSIDPGLGVKEMDKERNVSLRKDLRIRYDARGVVQELSSP
jgi:hypothetical protein